MSADNFQPLHVVGAGQGYPRDLLTPLRKKLLRLLHEAPSLDTWSAPLHSSAEELRTELAPLVAAHLVEIKNNSYRPTFVIASANEVSRVAEHARALAPSLAQVLLHEWGKLSSAFQELSFAHLLDFSSIAFFFVGDMVLDTGLLDALQRDGSLMPPPPVRPAPRHPENRYYLWMIEGDRDQLGHYGQRAIELPQRLWYLLTFGRYYFGDQINASRQALESTVRQQAKQDGMPPSLLAGHLQIPLVNHNDGMIWQQVGRVCADALVAIYRECAGEIRALYSSLRASRYVLHGFGEFFCWYNHLVYAHAIDILVDAGVMSIPPDGYEAVIWEWAESS